ncbi:hypothetical protein D5S17_35715 [Pseudonocardiaceae bacterium YIM PH 21723]|nr:hypothetical protein D5S17_35715 [Pseudonocardiaceae bacterium YIM PH 21723]
MSQNQETRTYSPADEPELDHRDRGLTAIWDISTANPEGWTFQAHLQVDHWDHPFKGKQYMAVLIASSRNGAVERPKIGATDGEVIIAEQSAPRFNRSALATFCTQAVETLRLRFAEGDQEVTAYFDSTSDKHDA